MPTKRYGVRVRPGDQKTYSVGMSAAPILSKQKRYGVQLDNRLVQFRKYPFFLQSYSRRSAVSMTPVRAKRREREFDAALSNPFVSDMQNTAYQVQIIETQKSHKPLIEAEALLRYLEPASKEQMLTAGNLTQEKGVRVGEQFAHVDDIQHGRMDNVMHTHIERLSKSERYHEELTHLLESDVSTVSNTLDVETHLVDSGTRHLFIESVHHDGLAPATHVIAEHEADITGREHGTVTRPILEATETEMAGADPPYMAAYEHIIYSGTRIQDIRDTDQLTPVTVERLNLSPAILETMKQGNESSRIKDAYHSELEQYSRLGRTYSGMEQILDATTSNVIIELASFSDVERTERKQKVLDASEQVADKTFNERKIVPAIMEYGRQAKPEPTMTRGTVLSIQEKTERSIRELTAALSESDHAENQVTIHNVDASPLVQAEIEKNSFKDSILSDQIVSFKVQESRPAHVVSMGAVKQITNMLLADMTLLSSVSGQENLYRAILSTMEAGDVDGMLVDVAKFDAAARLQSDRLTEYSDASKSLLANSVLLAKTDEQESVFRDNGVKSATWSDAHNFRFVTNTLDVYVQGQEQTINKQIPEEAQLITLQPATNPMKLTEAIEIGGDKAYKAEYWIDSVLHVSTQATTSTEYREAMLTLPGNAEKIRIDSEVTLAANDAGKRQMTSLASLHVDEQAVKDSIYATHLQNRMIASPHTSPEVALFTEISDAWTNSERFGQAVMLGDMIRATSSLGEYEVHTSGYDAADSAGRKTFEHRIEGSNRKSFMYTVDLTNPGNAETSSQYIEGHVTPSASMKRSSGIINAIQDDTERVSRSDIETDAIFSDTMPAIYANNDEIVYIEVFEHGSRLNAEPAFRSDKLYQAERLKENDAVLSSDSMRAIRSNENDAILSRTDKMDRISENDAILSGSTERMERIDVKPALLGPIESSERIATVDVWMTFNEDAERRYLEETQLILWETADRIMTDVVQLEETIKVERIAVTYTQLADFTRGDRTLKFGVLVDAETAERRDIEPALLDAYEPGELVTKKKKKIWLIPGRGNHWNNWSGWKKTR